MGIQEYFWLVLCWEVCPLSECPLSFIGGFTVSLYPHLPFKVLGNFELLCTPVFLLTAMDSCCMVFSFTGTLRNEMNFTVCEINPEQISCTLSRFVGLTNFVVTFCSPDYVLITIHDAPYMCLSMISPYSLSMCLSMISPL